MDRKLKKEKNRHDKIIEHKYMGDTKRTIRKLKIKIFPMSSVSWKQAEQSGKERLEQNYF
jgi:hypothetical protein